MDMRIEIKDKYAQPHEAQDLCKDIIKIAKEKYNMNVEITAHTRIGKAWSNVPETVEV